MVVSCEEMLSIWVHASRLGRGEIKPWLVIEGGDLEMLVGREEGVSWTKRNCSRQKRQEPSKAPVE